MYLSINHQTAPKQKKKKETPNQSCSKDKSVIQQLSCKKKKTKKNLKAKSVSRTGEKDIISRPNLCATVLRGIIWRARFYT
jgi:hypothetical protein